MKMISLLFLVLMSTSCVSQGFIERESLFGEYTFASGETFYETFFLDVDGNFYSFLHEMPANEGTWRLVGSEIHFMDAADRDFNQIIKIIKLNKDTAIFHTQGLQKPATYHRTYNYKELEQQ